MEQKEMEYAVSRMKWLVETLEAASRAYYQKKEEIMSNHEWDVLYQELETLEASTGIRLSASPTQKVGYPVISALPKEAHKVPALSLDKTKELEPFLTFLNGRPGVLSWKLDGLTVVLTYENGILQKAVTRGDGLVGEVITENAKAFLNVPLTIPEQQPLTVRGEAIITYEDFEAINAELPEDEEPYKNPRNLCSGSVRQLNPEITRQRRVRFIAFSMVSGRPFQTRIEQFAYLEQCGFDVVEHHLIERIGDLEQAIPVWEERVRLSINHFPSDGLVLQHNDIQYGESLGMTSKFPKDTLVLKWQDAEERTVVTDIHWSASRTGRINPVAVFQPVELEGTTVTRASIHNVSMVKKLQIIPGDIISVYKANMIIPQVAENLTRKGQPEIPSVCPVCGGPTEIQNATGEAETLWCINPECAAKHVEAFVHMVKRDALNVDGLSKESLRKLIDAGLLSSLSDIFRLKDKEQAIVGMDGWGQKSFTKLIKSIDAARNTNLQRLIYALGIENVGRTASKLICRHFQYDVRRTVTATKEELLKIPDIGETIANHYCEWFGNIHNQELFETLLEEVHLEVPEQPMEKPSLAGKVFVVTGAVHQFKNRDELKANVEALGGKVTGSVSSKTDYLVNNDSTSTSGKNKKAKELGIPIITEMELLAMMK